MESKITRSFSHLPAYRLWIVSILSMTIPPLIGIFSFDFSKVGDATDRLVFFCGYYVKLIEKSNVVDFLYGRLDMTIATGIALMIGIGIIAMWFFILALPAFNHYSMKKRARMHVIQFIYAGIQAAAGYDILRETYGSMP